MDNIIIQLNKINGSLFYALEYYIYLKENNRNYDIIIRCKQDLIQPVLNTIKDKYKSEYYNILLNDIQFRKGIIYSDTIIVLDFSTFELLNKKILYKKCYYNFTNEIDSTIKTFSEFSTLKNIIPFGDSSISKVQYNYPLLLNFKMFKEIKTFQTNVLEEILNITSARKIINNFHSSFNKLIYHHTQFDRANRLIPECKFYNKEIIIIPYNIKNDSICTRIHLSTDELDINNSNFLELLTQ